MWPATPLSRGSRPKHPRNLEDFLYVPPHDTQAETATKFCIVIKLDEWTIFMDQILVIRTLTRDHFAVVNHLIDLIRFMTYIGLHSYDETAVLPL